MEKRAQENLLSPETVENIHHCNKCGLCMAACPVYKELLVEWASPRGKVQISRHLLQGDLEISPRIKEILSKCLLCGSCVTACPSGVQGDRLFSGFRWQVTRRYGVEWRKRLLFQVLAHPWLASGSARVGGWARSLLGEKLQGGIKAGNLALGRIPPFNSKPFSSVAPEVANPQGRTRARVLYFHGCATNYLFGRVGEAVLSVLPRMGVQVITPRNQGCCGVPIFLSGAREESLESIAHVVKTFGSQEVDAVVVDCATCGSAFVREYPHILRELKTLGKDVSQELIQAAELLALKTRDVTAFVGDHMSWLPDLPAQGPLLRVTYHDPCHLLKAQGVGILPRKVLASLPNVEFVEMQGADACCGGGGSFQVEHPDISASITQKKIQSIQATRAMAVATGCPGCRITIGAHLDPGLEIQVLHPIELLDLALRPAGEPGALTPGG